MYEFTDGERAYLAEMRALTTDVEGREVLVGLTAEETAVYMAHSRARLAGKPFRAGSKKYLGLREKHERARLEVLGAEIFVRTETPQRH